MLADFERMRENGANAVWIGHNNPGEVDASKVEPGMSYAVYAALQDPADPLYSDARAMADAVRRALDAARAARLGVILPIGYQIQMGSAWNAKHPGELRRTADGALLEFYDSGYTASPYSAQYRADIRRYYEWIRREYVAPYQDVIHMLSLADEPMGGDYSQPARAEFARRYGKAMDDLRRDELPQLGEFQAGVIADYAEWGALEWERLNPDLLITMSFHGGDSARRAWGLPEVERLFAQAPRNFVITFDAYLHDDLANKPATPDEAAQLKLFLRTIGNFSRVYGTRLALWGGVNAWGMAQESSAPLNVPDAVTNLLLLYDLPVRMGGNLWGIFAWNYNVKEQGLENYARPTTYDLRAMEIAVNRAIPLLRSRPQIGVPPPPDGVILVSAREMYAALGEARAAQVPPLWFDATAYARAFADREVVIAEASSPGSRRANVWNYIVAAGAKNLDAQTKGFLKLRLDEGANILSETPALAREWNVPFEEWRAGLDELPEGTGSFYIIRLEE
jgi:hypothetical protein